MEKKIKITLRDGNERELITHGGSIRTGGEYCKKGKNGGCAECKDYLC